jgi:phenylalanine ammonia-lyase
MILNLLQKINNAQTKPSSVTLTGEPDLTITDIVTFSRNSTSEVKRNIPTHVSTRQSAVFDHMMEQVKSGTPIYGVTTAYGAQANAAIDPGIEEKRYEDAKALSNAIIHVDVSTGPILPDEITRAAMLIRLNMLLPGYSAVRMESLNLLIDVLNKHLTPLVGQYGTVGASGDLALNGRVLSMLLHRPETKVKDQSETIQPASEMLPKNNISKLELEPKEGLGFVNGDNFSTAATALLTHDLTILMLYSFAIGALSIQGLEGSNRNFHPLLSALRPHPGQKEVSEIFANLLDDSKLALQEMAGHQPKKPGKIVQDPYSIRCLPQYYGPDWETLNAIWETVEINANSVSDNPLWTTPETVTEGEEPYKWVSGGNFLAMHMADACDKLRKIATHIVKQNDRHLNRLVNPNLNNGLPANLSPEGSVSRCVFKGLQTQMGMYEVYASVLAVPVSTAFGVHEELNQDITSHAMTSAIMTRQVVDLAKYALATNLIAACQAIDLRGGRELLSPATKPLYDWLRTQVPFIKTEQPLGQYVEEVASELLSDKGTKIICLTTIK